jgi:hypothetical protein
MCLILHAECAQHEANREIRIKVDKNDKDVHSLVIKPNSLLGKPDR